MDEIRVVKGWVFDYVDQFERFARATGRPVNIPNTYTHIIITDDVQDDVTTFGARRAVVVVYKFEGEHEYKKTVLMFEYLPVKWCAWDAERTIAVLFDEK